MSHYIPRYCVVHGDFEMDIDNPSDCQKCEIEVAAQLVAWKRDAWRYRWLVQHAYVSECFEPNGTTFRIANTDKTVPMLAPVDEAIDAAIGACEKPQKDSEQESDWQIRADKVHVADGMPPMTMAQIKEQLRGISKSLIARASLLAIEQLESALKEATEQRDGWHGEAIYVKTEVEYLRRLHSALIQDWPNWRKLVDGFMTDPACNSEWDKATRDSMVEFAKEYILPAAEQTTRRHK